MDYALWVSTIHYTQADAWLNTSRSEAGIRNSLETVGGKGLESLCAVSILLDPGRKGGKVKKNELDSPCPQRIPSLAGETGTSTNSPDPGQTVTEANWKSQQSMMGPQRQEQLITVSQAADI